MSTEVGTCSNHAACLSFVGTICLFSLQATSQQSTGAKVCVALINNRTTELLSTDRMTARLVKAVADKKRSAVAMAFTLVTLWLRV
jgi:hypothetical protein